MLRFWTQAWILTESLRSKISDNSKGRAENPLSMEFMYSCSYTFHWLA